MHYVTWRLMAEIRWLNPGVSKLGLQGLGAAGFEPASERKMHYRSVLPANLPDGPCSDRFCVSSYVKKDRLTALASCGSLLLHDLHVRLPDFVVLTRHSSFKTRNPCAAFYREMVLPLYCIINPGIDNSSVPKASQVRSVSAFTYKKRTVSPQQQEHKLARRDAPPIRATTDIGWLPGEIGTFLSLITFGHNTGWDNSRRISVALKNKVGTAQLHPLEMSGQVQNCYDVLAAAGLLGVPLEGHVERCSKALDDSFKLKIAARTPEEKEVWNWRCTLQKTFIKRSTAANQQATLEPRSLSSDEVEDMSKLFLKMESFNSTSIMKVLKVIKDREDEFGIKAKVLYIGWKRN
ncbi:hypothetical protein B0H13DRAFT_1864400 [Mycena leptocephala]|nr:hypothetical protein B0H13DRAFT_1864400 [Mycena leptocephala]